MTVMTKTMTTESSMHFSHNKPNDTPWRADGLRDFFLYRDLGIAKARAAGMCVVALRTRRREAMLARAKTKALPDIEPAM